MVKKNQAQLFNWTEKILSYTYYVFNSNSVYLDEIIYKYFEKFHSGSFSFLSAHQLS